MWFRWRRREHSNGEAMAPWGREKLLVMLAGVTVGAVTLLVGLGLAVWFAVSEPGTPSATAPVPAALSVRDRLAAAPMVELDPQAAFIPDPATTPAAPILVPAATLDLGPADVPTGFPQTPHGAVGQLAAIEKAVLESMSLPQLAKVHTAWVQPGGPALEEWELTRNVQSFLASARQGGQEKDLATLVSVTPAAAMVKGVDGPGWTVACVLVDVRAAIREESRMGYGLCSRMEWVEGRWQVAAGAVPAPAPSAWPGSRAALEAGWLAWVEAP
jgi:hypothetical protein